MTVHMCNCRIYIYTNSKNWNMVYNLRQTMKAKGKGVRKQPGCSVIEINGEVHEFFCRG